MVESSIPTFEAFCDNHDATSLLADQSYPPAVRVRRPPVRHPRVDAATFRQGTAEQARGAPMEKLRTGGDP